MQREMGGPSLAECLLPEKLGHNERARSGCGLGAEWGRAAVALLVQAARGVELGDRAGAAGETDAGEGSGE